MNDTPSHTLNYKRRLATLAWITSLLLGPALPVRAIEIPEAAHEFHFVVLGDSQFHDAAGFNRIIDEVTRLQPAFVIQVGDMIEGYLPDTPSLHAEWKRFRNQVAPLGTVPFIPVPGNHDVYDATKLPSRTATDIYRQYWGELFFTFTYKNARFIVLNSDMVGEDRSIAGAQLKWLGQVLGENRMAHTFVLMHRPPDSLKNAERLHDLFRRHGVRHVIYGHHHHYHFRNTDGIRYVMTNAAANSGTKLAETGSFDHLLHVSVRDDEVRLAPITAGAILPEDIVSPIDNYDNFDLAEGLLPDWVKARPAGKHRWMVDLPLHNPSSRAITVHLTCASPDGRWDLSPVRIPAITLASKARQTVSLEASHRPDRVPEGRPHCTLFVPYQTSRGLWVRHEDTVDVRFASGSR